MKEMQELIEAAENFVKCRHAPCRPEFTRAMYQRLARSVAAARAYEGGWIDCTQDPPPLDEPLLIVYQGVVQHLTYTLLEDGWYPHDTDSEYFLPIERGELVTHYQRLPSPPLSVETPEVQK